MKIVFATNNSHKLDEMRGILGERVQLLSLADIGCHDDIPETANTLEGNAIQKARYIASRYHTDCFADDTGLEVDALGGEPGVLSARYAGGAGHDSEANMRKLLARLGDNTHRSARFRTVIALARSCEEADFTLFEGTVEGTIATAPRGDEGFGYDPVFVPEGHDKTFAQLGEAVKNSISHRARAAAKLARHLAAAHTDDAE